VPGQGQVSQAKNGHMPMQTQKLKRRKRQSSAICALEYRVALRALERAQPGPPYALVPKNYCPSLGLNRATYNGNSSL
jgi:hypothetical protein